MIGLLVILGSLLIQLVMYMIAFPEVSIFLLFSAGILFPTGGIEILDPAQGAAQMVPFEVTYPLFQFINVHVSPWHPAMRVLFILGCLGAYILLTKFVNIKGIYVFQIAGVLLVGYLSFMVMSKGFQLALIWNILITIAITFLAAALRYSVLNPSD